MIDIITTNPYREVGMYAASPTREFFDKLNIIRASLKDGQQVSYPLDLNNLLPTISRSEESCLIAAQRMSIITNHPKYAQFWFFKSTKTDEIAFEKLISGDIDGAIEIWSKEDTISSLQNRIVCFLIKNQLANAIHYAEKLYSSYSNDFIKIVFCNEKTDLPYNLVHEFLNAISEEYSYDEILNCITNKDWKEYVESKRVKPTEEPHSMLNKIYFPDNQSRKFVPYKGWIKENGESDELTHKQEKNELYSIVDNESNNKNGNLNGSKHKDTYQIADCNGNLIVNEYFDKISYFSNDAVLVKKENKYNILLLTGKFLLDNYVDCICCLYKDCIYYVDLGILYSTTFSGDVKKYKVLSELSSESKYQVGRFVIEKNKKIKGFQIGYNIYENDDITGVDASEFPAICYRDYPIYALSDDYEDLKSMNNIINGKYLLFDNWYESVIQYNYGPYRIKSKDTSFLATATGEFIQKIDNEEYVVVFNKYYNVVKLDNLFHIYNNNYELIHSDFTSIIWNDVEIWGVNTFSPKSQKHYYHSECELILFYAHEVLLGTESVALFEKNDIWYYIDNRGQLLECFRNYKLKED